MNLNDFILTVAAKIVADVLLGLGRVLLKRVGRLGQPHQHRPQRIGQRVAVDDVDGRCPLTGPDIPPLAGTRLDDAAVRATWR